MFRHRQRIFIRDQKAFTIDRGGCAPVNDPAVPALRPCGFPAGYFPGGIRHSLLGSVLLIVLLACGGKGVSPQDADRSMKQYELAIGLHGEGNSAGAFHALYKSLEIDPTNAKAHLLLGNLFLLKRDDNPGYDEKVEHHFREVLRIQAGEQRQPEQSLVPDARNGLGVLYVHQKKYPAAVAELTKAVEDLFNRDAYMAWGNLGWAYLEMQDYPKAIDALIRAVRLHPRFCVGYYRLGRAYMATREHEKAEQAFTQAIEADERCATFQDAWHLRGEARMNLGLRDDARSDFERCAELDPSNAAGKSCGRYLEATY
jgi:tetratricopeptide (TPR) repeat protein